jgi:phospholipase/carboxylesterase
MSRPLIVALHGVGSSARDMAAALAPLQAFAEVVALDGRDPFDGGGAGRQWFSIAGVTEADRPARVAEALPSLIGRLDLLAEERGLAREEMVLLGFSQGAIMTLAMVAQGLHPGRAVAIAGRLAAPVVQAGDRPASVLLIHDSADRIMPVALSADAAAQLSAAGHHVKLIGTDGIGHSIGFPTTSAIADWLATTDSSRNDSSQQRITT